MTLAVAVAVVEPARGDRALIRGLNDRGVGAEAARLGEPHAYHAWATASSGSRSSARVRHAWAWRLSRGAAGRDLDRGAWRIVQPMGLKPRRAALDAVIDDVALDPTSAAITFAAHRDGVQALAISGDGRLLATGGLDRVIRLFALA